MALTRAGFGKVRSGVLAAIALAAWLSAAIWVSGARAQPQPPGREADRAASEPDGRAQGRARPAAHRAAGRGDRRRSARAADRRSTAGWRPRSTARIRCRGSRSKPAATRSTRSSRKTRPSRWRGSQSLILSGTTADAALKLAGTLQSDGLLDVLDRLRSLARDDARRRGGSDRRGAGRARPARCGDRRPPASHGAALSRPARRQRRNRRRADAALCRDGDGGPGGRSPARR